MTTTEARARLTDPETSHEAAASIGSEALRRSQVAVLEVLKVLGPMNDVALVSIYEMQAADGQAPRQSPSGIRSRRAELVDADLVEDTGQREKLPSGRNSIIWRAK